MVWICWKWVLLVFECLKTPLIQPCFWKIYLLGTDFWVGRFFFPSAFERCCFLSPHVWRLPRRKQVSLSSLFLARNVAFLIWTLCHWFWVTGDDVLCLQFSLSLENCGQNFFKCCFLSLPLFSPVEKLVYHIWGYMESLIGHWCWSLCVLVFFFLRLFLAGYFNLDSFYYERFKFTSPNLFSVLSFATDQIQCTFHFILISRSLIWDFYIFHVSTFWTFRMEYS